MTSHDNVTDIVERQNDKPPMHWKPDEKYERFPQTEQEWDWREDPVGKSLERGMARLLFAYCYADPHAPDQMALVLRKDLGAVNSQLTIASARLELRNREIETLHKQLENAREALDQIADPIGHAQKIAKDGGMSIDGHMAVRLANDAEYLKGIATRGLRGLS